MSASDQQASEIVQLEDVKGTITTQPKSGEDIQHQRVKEKKKKEEEDECIEGCFEICCCLCETFCDDCDDSDD